MGSVTACLTAKTFRKTLLLFIMLVGAASPALAGEFCVSPNDPAAPWGTDEDGDGINDIGIIDGSDLATVQFFANNNITQITIDGPCTFQNWSESNPLDVQLNFQTTDNTVYLITFDNVFFGGGMVCANIDHKLWVVNSPVDPFSFKCQDLFIPVEAIDKVVNDDLTSVGIGEPFKYTLNFPYKLDYSGVETDLTGTDVDVDDAVIIDDLNAIAADLTLLSVSVSHEGVPLTENTDYTLDNTANVLTFDFNGYGIAAGTQVAIELELVADSGNPVGTTFFNTVSWTFSRIIAIDPDGDGIFDQVRFDPLTGENGISPLLTIGEPDLIVTKSTLDTTLTPDSTGDFTVEVENVGTSSAWDITIEDILPTSGTASMCVDDPTTLGPVTADIYNGATLFKSLTEGVGNDFTVVWDLPSCTLTLVTEGTNSVIEPGQRMEINYTARLDINSTQNGEVLRNHVAATEWFSADAGLPRDTFTSPITDPVTAALTGDHEDSTDVTVGLANYYFQKTVSNVDTGANPATTAVVGERLRYRLRVFNVDEDVNNVVITDTLDVSRLVGTSFTPFVISGPASTTVTFNQVSGALQIDGGGVSLDIARDNELIVDFEIDTLGSLTQGETISNQASLTSDADIFTVLSDDPFVNGVDDPQDGGLTTPDETVVTINELPVDLSKSNGPATATIGETLTYTIRVPAVAAELPIYDVAISDTLGYNDNPTPGVAANISLISASGSLELAGTTFNLTNTGSTTAPVIQDLVSGIDIPAGDRAVLTITARVDNTTTNQAGVAFKNLATYTYYRINGDLGAANITAAVVTTTETVIEEPGLATFTKTADNIAPTVGETVHYTVTVEAASGANISDVFDLTLVDNLDLGLAYVVNSAEVCTGAAAGTGCAPVLSTDVTGDGITTAQTLTWGVADVDIDIPAGNTIFFEYDVLVLNNVLANQVLNNTVIAQWTGIDGSNGFERDGSDGAGGVLNDYATAAVTETLTIPNINATIEKIRSDDTYGAGDDDVRIGDIIEYSLTIPMPEGTLGNVQIVDTLPQGLAFVDIVSINGNIGPAPYSENVPFSHNPIAAPTIAGDPATGPSTVTWSVGNLTNQLLNDGPNDFVIIYRARVLNNVFAQVNSTPLNNSVTMSYDTAIGTVTSSDTNTITLLQPLMSAVTKVERTGLIGTAGTPLNVTVATDTMLFRLESCNTAAPAAPAYSVLLSDVLATQLDETSLTVPVVSIDGTALLAGDYTYTPPGGRGGTLSILLNTPVNPGQCVTVDYNIGFYTDFGPNEVWNNSVTLDEYWSLPQVLFPGEGEQYLPVGPAQFFMTNQVAVEPLTKVVASPAGTEVTIGEEVVYTITVPGIPVNAALDNVAVSDSLHAALEYVSATAVDGGGPVALTDNSVAPGAVSLTIAQIPAGEQVIITLTTRVANDADANAGVSFTNTADYTYTGIPVGSVTTATSGALLIVEPAVAIAKTVAPSTPPIAGDTLTYSVTFNASSGANFSDAFDLRIDDSLSLGLEYVPGTASVDGTGNTVIDPIVTGDGVTTAQTLVWSLENTTADIDIVEGSTVTVTYDVLVLSSVLAGQNLTNSVTAQWTSLDAAIGDPVDDNERNGTNTPAENDYFSGPATTLLTTPVPGDPVKANPATTTVTIGEEFTYTITIPQIPLSTPLHDVRILDNLGATGVDLTVVSIDNLSGGTWVPQNTGIAPDLVIEDITTGGIEIPADGQIVVGITVRLNNVAGNFAGGTFTNTASYTYNQVDGGNLTELLGGSNTTTALTITEPTVVMSKSFANSSNPGNPPVAGDVLRYTLQLDASGGVALDNFSDAFDISIIDDLSLGLAFQTGTASINAAPLANPVNVTGGDGITTAQQLRWSLADGDDIDIPEGVSVSISYDVLVLNDVVAGQNLTNSAVAQWTGLDGVDANERDGSDGAGVEPNDYETAPQVTLVTVPDNTVFTKSVTADTDVATAIGTLRIGDTVTYQLDITLQEGVTNGISVNDTLDAGLEFVGIVSINGDTVADYDPPGVGAGSNFGYSTITAASLPAAGATGTLGFTLGDVSNDPLGDATTDTLTIIYQASVVTGVLAQNPTTTLNNNAQLTYNTTSSLNTAASVTVLQPVMSTVIKLGNGAANTNATPLTVNVASDTVQFTIVSCNTTGLAPAYNLQLTDVLASQLDETSLVDPTVTINGALATNGVNYNYTAPAVRGGTVVIDLIDGVNPGQCVTAVYDIGFYTDFGPNELWSNSVTVDEYWSQDAISGEQYAGSGPATFWMINAFTVEPLSKSVVSPASEITVGELVSYQIVVPASPVNAALDNVSLTDTLHDALLYQSDAAGVFNGGGSVTLNEVVAGQDISWTISQIPAGEQVTITFTARVGNNSFANAGVSFDNTAAYTYTGMGVPTLTQATSGALLIIEPELTIGKTVTNTTTPGVPPVPGDILQYSVTFTAGGGAVGDDFSDAFDLLVEDSLGLGLLYVAGSAIVDGTGNAIADPATNGGDGINTAQTLSWDSADAAINLEVVEGSIVTVTYNVEVLAGVQAGQDLTNSAIVQWTGIEGIDAFERNGTGAPAENDYFTGPAITTITTQFEVSYTKSVVNTSTTQDPGTNASPGDILQYTLEITNQSVATLTNGAVIDELAAEFEPNTTLSVSVTGGGTYTDNSSGTGGVNGTGIIDISNITLAPQGNNPDDTVTIVFTATLASVIDSGTTVLNQGQLTGDNLPVTVSNQTSTLIDSAPLLEVWKSSQDLTGDAAVLVQGDTLRYNITVNNIGNENLVNTVLSDQIPSNTTYVAGTTILNGAVVADPSAGVSPLEAGMPINTSDTATAGLVSAAPGGLITATITFDVTVNASAIDGTVISNQGFVSGEGGGSGAFPQQPSDDPDTTALVDDPTLDVVGSSPVIDVLKTVVIADDNGNGFVDPNETLLYTITIRNIGTAPATGVELLDDLDALNTPVAFVPGSLNIVLAPAGADTSNTDPNGGVNGTGLLDVRNLTLEAAGGVDTVEVIFEIQVNGAVVPGNIISNQGFVSSNETPVEPSDADGIDVNGDQPTEIIVGNVQLVSITKQVLVVNSNQAEAGGELEYVVRVTNTGSIPATNVVITDTLDLANMTYITGSGLLDGLPAGVSFTSPTVTADYATAYGNLPVGGVAELRFRVTLNSALIIGSTVSNTADVSWSLTPFTDSATVVIDIGGTPGSANLNGQVWHDTDYDNIADGSEALLQDWTVELYRNNVLLADTLTDVNGVFQFSGLLANLPVGDAYELRYISPGADANTPTLGQASSVFANGPQRITDIFAASGSSLQNLDLPRQPNGIVYDSVFRVPVAGVQLSMINQTRSNQLVPASCFEDPNHQNQLTPAEGYYKFDLNFSDPTRCAEGDEYEIQVLPPADGYVGTSSIIIPPVNPVTGAAQDVPNCPATAADSIAATAQHCENSTSSVQADLSVLPRTAGTNYYLKFLFNDVPVTDQIFNNHIPIDPELDDAVSISKESSLQNVTRSQLVPYTITVNNTLPVPLVDLNIIDTMPAGFKYVTGSSRLDGAEVEPLINGRQLTWPDLRVDVTETRVIKLLLVVGSGVGEGEYVNTAHIINSLTSEAASGVASATVRVIPDPTFDCTDIIGKVFDDKNQNAYQDEGERGLAGVRLATARGLRVTTDAHGRFHITCAIVPNEIRGSNFIMKVDDRTLPSGYRITTENPRVQRATRGKMLKFNFGATIHRIVRLDLANGVFEKDSTELRPQWHSRIGLLINELQKDSSILRLSYLAENETESEVEDRLDAIDDLISNRWQDLNCCYKLKIEKEVFWRKGKSSDRMKFK